MTVYIDGEYFDEQSAKISVLDHGLLYGDGIFEGIRIYNGKVFKLDEHLERLYLGARAIGLTIPLDFGTLKSAVEGTVAKEGEENGYIRLVITRGKGTLGIDPHKCEKASVIIIVSKIQLYPEEFYAKGISVITASIRKSPATNIDSRIKSLNYLLNIMAKTEANEAGCQEALILNTEGYVAECSADNIFYITKGKVITPSTLFGALGGITRGTVLDLAANLNIEAEEKAVTCFDLYTADECFLTGTGAEIVPVIKIDGRPIDNGKPGPMTLRLREEFKKLL
jgi:branched-chain amino acid aminotransferase